MRARSRGGAPAGPAHHRPGRAAIWMLAAISLLAVWDTWRLGLFADDFIFLDAARRFPASEVLLGQHGIAPWYRPLSAALYFYLLNGAGSLGPQLARLLSAATLVALALGTYSIGRRLVGARAAAIGAGALAVSAGCKFLVGWASGFQDLLATALMVAALALHAGGRRTGSLVCAALAPFAKETGFLVLPLLAGFAWIVEHPRPRMKWWLALAGVGAADIAVHLLVRTTWPPGSIHAREATVAFDLLPALGELARDFLPAPELPTWAGLIAVPMAWLSWRLMKSAEHDGRAVATGARATAFVGFAILCGLAPIIAAVLVGPYKPAARFAMPATPWITLAAGSALGSLSGRAARIIAVAWLVSMAATLTYRRPDLNRPEAWQTGALGWREAVRIEARTRRLEADLRRELATRPESTVVLYAALPYGAWFQTMDGPATRVALDDPSVRAYPISDAPLDVPPERIAIAEYDPVETHHLKLAPQDCDLSLRRCANAIVQVRPRAARAWAEWCRRADRTRGLADYFLAVSLLQAGGEAPYARALHAGGLLDSAAARGAPGPASAGGASRGVWSGGPGASFTGQPTLDERYRPALRAPRSAPAHLETARLLEERGVSLLAAVELRTAGALAPLSDSAHAELGRILETEGLHDLAATELHAGHQPPAGAPGGGVAR